MRKIIFFVKKKEAPKYKNKSNNENRYFLKSKVTTHITEHMNVSELAAINHDEDTD